MKQKNQKRNFIKTWWGVVLIVLIFSGGFFFTHFITRYGENLEEIRLQSLADTAAASFDTETILKLKGLPADSGTEAFTHVREQLKRIHEANPDSRFVYLMALKKGNVIFLADAEPVGSKDYSAPGDIYKEASPWLIRALTTGTPFTEGPLADAWGEWVTGWAPIMNPATGQVIAVLGMDISAKQWNAAVSRYQWFGMVITALVLGVMVVLVLGMYFQRRSNLQIAHYNRELNEELAKRKLVEKALREQERKISSVFLAAPVGIGVVIDRVFQEVNDTLCQMTGYSREELLGRSARLLYPTQQDYDYVGQEKYRQIAETWTGSVETRCEKKDGTIMDIILSSTPLDTDDLAKGVTFTALDITASKQAEAAHHLLEERLQRAERMESLGLMAGGVAHDLNNVLGILIGYAELLCHDVQESSPVRSYATNIMGASARAAAIIQDMLTLARRGVQTREAVNLNTLIMGFMKTPELEKLSAFHPNVQIATNLETELLPIMGSPVQLGKTIMNLISNAAEAMPMGGLVTVTTGNQYLDRPVQGYDEVSAGDYVVLAVTDAGEGISAKDINQIFEPFYTKKVMGRSGTGLGLAVVWGAVKDHHGYIDVRSEEEKGSTFTLYFPVTREEIKAEDMAVHISAYMGRGETILVVDDVEGQRELAAAMLRKLNYTVTIVSSGEEAVAYLKDHVVDLLVLDMIMDPGMDGLDTYRCVLEIHPRQKAVIVSGFSETERVNAAQALGAGPYVKKPYILEKLGLGVRKELNRIT
jgi:PAS domain S-box-containing protein